VIWGDDIGWQNVSAYGMGRWATRRRNIDRIGMEGIRFTDHYAQPRARPGARPSSPAVSDPLGHDHGRRAGDKLGLQAASPSLAEVLKKAGYRTGQFGKNHLGDTTSTCPPCTVRRILRQPLSPEHRGAERVRRLPGVRQDLPGRPEAFAQEVRTRGVLHASRPTGRPTSTRASAASASRRSRTPGRSR
jgi:arylsulfatase